MGPVRALAKARDELRAEHVRALMAAAMQLEAENPELFTSMVERVKSAGDMRVMIGDGNCAGSHGSECRDYVTSDSCLPIRSYLEHDLLPELPVDPNKRLFTVSLPGYYLQFVDEGIEVGACGAATREVKLEHEL